MKHDGVSGLPVLAIAGLAIAALVSLAACAGAPPASEPAAVRLVVSERCGDGTRPIEILAADVVIAIDRSASTRTTTGLDLDEFSRSTYTERDDSLFAAELAAVARLIAVARLGGMRFAIVSYSGRETHPLEDSVTQHVDRQDARLEAALTDDLAELEAAVARVAQRGPDGASSFAPAMRLAVRSLDVAADDGTARRRRVLFIADTPRPVRYAPMDQIAYDDARMEVEARRAIASRVSFHSFGIGEAASADPVHALAQIAGATGGTYRAVPDPRGLYCHMLAALGTNDSR